MGITQKKMLADNPAGWMAVSLDVTTVGNSQADVNFASTAVPFAFQVVSVAAWARTVTATATVDVKIGTTSCLASAITPTSSTTAPAVGTLSTTMASRRGASGASLRLHATTNGSGAFADLTVVVFVRPYPVNNEA